MKYFIFSDVHSYYDELMKALNEKGFDIDNKEHCIISLGDLCDRGPDPVKCLEFVTDLYDKGRAILVRGNHEDLMEAAICKRYFESHDYHNCTHETVMKLTNCDIHEYGDELALTLMKENPLWNKYSNATVDYYELDDNIFVHGWIPTGLECEEGFDELPMFYRPYKEVYDPQWRDSGDWLEARWLNGMKMWNNGIREPNKTIWCGHFHSSWGNSILHNDGVQFLNKYETFFIDPDTGKQEPHVNHAPFKDDGIVAIDACTAISGIVNCEVIEK